MQFIDINFQFGEFTYTDLKTSKLWSIISSLFFAFLGFGFSYFLFWRKTKYDELIKNAEKKENEINQLKYFANQVDSIIKSTEIQISNLNLYIDYYKKNPTGFKRLSFKINRNLNRIQESTNQEKFYNPYLNHFNNLDKSINSFNEIFLAIDLIYEITNNIKNILNDGQVKISEKKVQYTTLMKDLFVIRDSNLGKFNATKRIENEYLLYIAGHDFNPEKLEDNDITVKYSYEKVFSPIIKKTIQKYMHYNEASQVLKICMEGEMLYKQLLSIEGSLIEAFEQMLVELSKSCNLLITTSMELRTKFQIQLNS